MLNHHTHPTDPIRDTKTNAFDTNMASPSRQHNFAVRVSHRYIVTVAEFGRSRRVWALPPSLGAPARDGHKIHPIGSSLGAPAEFGRSPSVWALSPCLSAPTEFGHSRKVLTLLPEMAIICIGSSLGASEFGSLGRSRQKQKKSALLLLGDDLYSMHIHMCWFVSIGGHSWFYALFGAWTLGLD